MMNENEVYYSEVFDCYYVGEMIDVCKQCERSLQRYIDSLSYDDDMATLKIQRKEGECEEILEREALRQYYMMNGL